MQVFAVCVGRLPSKRTFNVAQNWEFEHERKQGIH